MDLKKSQPKPSQLPFKSKKKLFTSADPDPFSSSSSIDPSKSKFSAAGKFEPEQLSWSSKTPEKPIQLSRRSKNRGFALSVREVKQMAEDLCRTANASPQRSDVAASATDLSLKGEKKIGKVVKRSDKCSVVECNLSRSSSGLIGKSQKAKPVTKLPEKYEMLVEFFNCMDSSIRLLRLKGSMTTFKNISPKVEILTNRRFTHSHLAQLKHILPEAIGIKKILSHDETTLCMKPDLQVTLQLDAFDNGKNERAESGSLALRKMFRSRLLDFIKTHPEADSIPEETLPEPFNQTKLSIVPKTTRTCSPSPAGSSSGALPLQPLASFSHLPGSFQRRFSQKTPIPESEKTQLELPNSPLNPVDAKTQYNSSDGEISNSAVSSSIVTFNSKTLPAQPVNCSSNTKTCKNPSSGPKKFLSLPTPIQSFPLSPLICEEKSKGAKIPTEMAGIERTPVKQVSTPTRLITTTPELQTPKRFRPSPSDDSTKPVAGAARNSTRTRSLNFFSPVKTDNVAPNMDIDPCSIHESAKSELERSSPSTDKDIIRFLPVSLLQSVREKQKIAMEEREMGLSGTNRRQQVIASLPKLFNMIHLIFQSANRSVITKKELVHKIIANHCDIIDRREIEEQLKLLQELVPEWIYGKMASSGDFLFCINKMSNTESVRAKLAEAE